MSELYLFQKDGVYFGFTPTVFSKIQDDIVYSPTLISRSNINLTNNFDKSPVNFKFERTHSFAKDILYNLPENPILVTIFRNGSPYWKGRVVGAKANPMSIDISCDSGQSTAKRQGLQPKIMLTCRHVLYGANCKVVQESWVTNFNVSGINSSSFSIPSLTASDKHYNGGIAKINGQIRNIIEQVGTVIKLTHPFTGVQTGVIALYPGCQHTEENCIAFSNLDNFGGFSRLPNKNPFGSTGLL